MLLDSCTGREIWSLNFCQQKEIPETWVAEHLDCFESGFVSDRQTIYENEQIVNQYEGVHDLDIAYKLAAYLGANVHEAVRAAISPEAAVRALKEAVEEL